MTIDLDAKVRAYASFFETITPERVDHVRALVTEDVRFKDPFNDVRGIDKLLKILAKMFEDADEIDFRMREQAGEGHVYFLRWHFTCLPKSRFLKGEWHVDGISVVTLSDEGLIKEHVDYWDAAEYLYDRLPVIGGLLRFLRRPLVLKD